MKLAIVALVVLLLLGGGGALVFFKRDELFPKSDATDEKTDTVASYLRAPVHFEVKALAVPVIRDNRIERYVLLQISLEMADEDALRETSRLSAKLHDAFINSLYDYYSYVTPATKAVNVPVLRKRLMRETERTLGKGLVKSITIKGVVQRRSDRK